MASRQRGPLFFVSSDQLLCVAIPMVLWYGFVCGKKLQISQKYVPIGWWENNLDNRRHTGIFPVQLQMFPAISERGQLKRIGDTLLIRFKDGTEIA